MKVLHQEESKESLITEIKLIYDQFDNAILYNGSYSSLYQFDERFHLYVFFNT